MRDRDAPNDTGINVRISSGPEFTSLRPFSKLVKCHLSRPCTSKNSFRHNSWEDGIFLEHPNNRLSIFLVRIFWDVYGYLGRVRNKGHFDAMRERYHMYHYIRTATLRVPFFSIGILFPTHPIAKPTKGQLTQEIRPSLSLSGGGGGIGIPKFHVPETPVVTSNCLENLRVFLGLGSTGKNGRWSLTVVFFLGVEKPIASMSGTYPYMYHKN